MDTQIESKNHENPAMVFTPSEKEDSSQNGYTELHRKMSEHEKGSSSFLYLSVCAGKFI